MIFNISWFWIWIRTLVFPLEIFRDRFRDFFSDYTNPIENTTNLTLNLRPIYLLRISISPDSILHFLPALCGTLGGALELQVIVDPPDFRSTAQVHLQWDYLQMHHARHSGIIYINCPQLKFLFFWYLPWLCSCVAGKETRCRSTADNMFPRSNLIRDPRFLEVSESLDNSVWFSSNSRWGVDFFFYISYLFSFLISLAISV